MDRRTFLVLSAIAILARSIAHLFIDDKSKPGFVQIRHFNSKIFPDRTYSSVEEFWSDHYCAAGDYINRIFKEKNLILKKNSFLDSTGKVLIQEKFFRSEKEFKIMNSLRRKVNTPDILLEIYSIEKNTPSSSLDLIS